MKNLTRIISKINEWIAKGVSFLLVAMMGTVCYEVIVRYFFNRPTIWSFDVGIYLLCVYSLLGGGFALLRGGHVNVDILYGRLGFRARAVTDCVTSVLFFMFIWVLLFNGWKMAHHALIQKEISPSLLGWPLFPTKVMVPIGAFLLFIQGTVKFLNDLITAITGRPQGEVKEGIFGTARKG